MEDFALLTQYKCDPKRNPQGRKCEPKEFTGGRADAKARRCCPPSDRGAGGTGKGRGRGAHLKEAPVCGGNAKELDRRELFKKRE